MSVRADRPFPPRKAGVDYFEVTVLQGEHGNDEAVAVIGMCSEFANLGVSLAGHQRFSIGYHSDDGMIYERTTADYSVRHEPIKCREYGENDTVGCGVDWDKGEYFFTLNGQIECVSLFYRGCTLAANFCIDSGKSLVIFRKLYPVISIKRGDKNVKLRVNFEENKMYDLNSRIASTPVISPTDSTQLVNS